MWLFSRLTPRLGQQPKDTQNEAATPLVDVLVGDIEIHSNGNACNTIFWTRGTLIESILHDFEQFVRFTKSNGGAPLCFLDLFSIAEEKYRDQEMYRHQDIPVSLCMALGMSIALIDKISRYILRKAPISDY